MVLKSDYRALPELATSLRRRMEGRFAPLRKLLILDYKVVVTMGTYYLKLAFTATASLYGNG